MPGAYVSFILHYDTGWVVLAHTDNERLSGAQTSKVSITLTRCKTTNKFVMPIV